MSTKICSKCAIKKPLTSFHKNNFGKDGRYSHCINCKKIYKAKFYKENKVEAKNRYKKYYENNKETIEDSRLKRKYNITLNDKNTLLLKQNNKCVICKLELDNNIKTHIDHCHKTNKVRGILCVNCNLGLGNFKDKEEYLYNAIEYLGGKK
jgi:hypothetical protein